MDRRYVEHILEKIMNGLSSHLLGDEYDVKLHLSSNILI